MKLGFGYRRPLLVSALVFVIYFACNPTMAQTDKPSPTPSPGATPQVTATPPQPEANPADVSSMDAIIAALYDVISGPEGKKRDWDRMRSLFVPGARLIPTERRKTGAHDWRLVTVEQYIARIGPLLEKEGFFEKELGRQTEAWGNIAQAFSSYESRHKPDDPKAFQRGINSFLLINDEKRWWILTVLWQSEDEKTPIPEKYLKKSP
jgi:hypothetical protein